MAEPIVTNYDELEKLVDSSAEKLIADLNWNKEEIGAIVFVSQTADYWLPATSCILQNRLGLSKECMPPMVRLAVQDGFMV